MSGLDGDGAAGCLAGRPPITTLPRSDFPGARGSGQVPLVTGSGTRVERYEFYGAPGTTFRYGRFYNLLTPTPMDMAGIPIREGPCTIGGCCRVNPATPTLVMTFAATISIAPARAGRAVGECSCRTMRLPGSSTATR